MLKQNVPYQQLQEVMDGVLHDLYQLPAKMRTTAKVLEFIHRRQQGLRIESPLGSIVPFV